MKNKYSVFSLIKNALSQHENWQQAWGNPEPKKEYEAIIVGVKAIAGILAVKVMKLDWKTALAVGFSIAQIGEFSFVLAQSGLKYELISQNNYQIFLAVSILLMSLTPFIVNNAERIHSVFGKLFKLQTHG
ncbi:MAG: cation:proton antiporter [Bacteroidota bacterium]